MNTNFRDIEFYKEFYENEHKRRNEIDNSVAFPTTLLTILIAGAFYLFEKIDLDSFFKDIVLLDTLIILFFIAFLITMILTIFFLMRTFINVFKKYSYLPSPLDLKNRETELFNHYKDFYEAKGNDKPVKKSIEKAKKQFNKDILNYYIEYGTMNQQLNDKRIKDYYKSRKYLIFSIIIIAVIGVLLIIK